MPEPTPLRPEVLAQIERLPHSDRPLIVCDVDEVILHFTSHLEDYLNANDVVFVNYEYRLTGNIAHRVSGELLTAEEAQRHLLAFFSAEGHQQQMVPGADLALNSLAADWDIVLLTNLPGGQNKAVRETLLASFGIPYPVVTNSGPKGGAVARLSAGRPRPLVFIDDSPGNHASVAASLPSAVQIQFIADARFRTLVLPEPHVDLLTGDWQQTAEFIQDILKPAHSNRFA